MQIMDWSRFARLWAYPGRNRSARARWEYIGRSGGDAMHMMDGSASEADLRRRGGSMAELFTSSLAIGPENHVLEVGCGVGRVGRELAPRCASWTGSDISRSLLRRARRRLGHLDHVQFRHLEMDGLAGLPDATWDRVYCHLVLLHVDAVGCGALVAGFHRVLTAEGLVYFDVWNRHHPDVAALALREERDASLRRQPHRSRFYGREDVEEWLQAAGLQTIWICDESFLVQVVAAPAAASASTLHQARQRLARTGPALIPRGYLDFIHPERGRSPAQGS